jgi:putative ABC transport system substrate-binding protein
MTVTIGRRELLAALGGAAAAWPLAARAQQAAMPVIGFLSSRSPEDSAHLIPAFAAGLAEGGYVEGQNLAIEFRWARGRYDLLPAMAAELVTRRVAVLTTAGGEPSALAAKRTTSTIPIVFGIGGDPVALGLVASFSRPGGNATGVTLLTNLMEPKRLGLLRELAPGVPLIGVLLNPKFAPASRQLQQVEETARSIDQRILVVRASTDEELETAFAAFTSERVGARFTPLRLLCSRHRLQPAPRPLSPIAVLGWAEAQVFSFAGCASVIAAGNR